MLRVEVLAAWERVKPVQQEWKELRPLVLRLKSAEWKTLAYRVMLFRDKKEYQLSDAIQLWEEDNYYKIKPPGDKEVFSLPESEKIVVSWQVLTKKYLVVKETTASSVEETLLSNETVQRLREFLETNPTPPKASENEKTIEYPQTKPNPRTRRRGSRGFIRKGGWGSKFEYVD